MHIENAEQDQEFGQVVRTQSEHFLVIFGPEFPVHRLIQRAGIEARFPPIVEGVDTLARSAVSLGIEERRIAR